MSRKNDHQAESETGAWGGEFSMPEMMRQVAQQNNRLLMLLEQITEDLFRQDGRNLDDAAKVRLLLRSLSVPVHEKFLNYLLPSHPRDFTFDDVVAKLKQIFGQQKSLFSKRYDCLKLEKSEADDFVSYAGIVNRQCEDFELQKLTVDQFKNLVFICGLKSTKDADCQRLSNLKHDTALVEKKPTSSAVQAVRHSRKQLSYQQKSSADGKTPPSPCWQCGAMHFVKDCQFSKHTCNNR
ncbi:uncharacterized protein LOC134290899 [Aedes albopictus]|uniref:DUF7083 domain-containing protein n=1 Tax=Aedes albopictus TaxID=7160 RepID=A0ABM1Z1J8_AEDAL